MIRLKRTALSLFAAAFVAAGVAPAEVTVIGGPVAIPDRVIADLDATRLAGDDRYGTSIRGRSAAR